MHIGREGADRPGSLRSRLSVASPYLLAGLLAASGTAHFLAPAPYASIVPRALPAPTALVYLSGAAELACAAGLAWPATRRRAGWATGALLLAVWPANLTMALQSGGDSGAYQAMVWLRMPLQVPLIWWALSLGRRGG